MWIDDLPALGAGIGFRPQLKGELFLDQDAADFLEITTDHYLEAGAAKLQELDLLAAHYPLIPHGLNLSLGSAEGLDGKYLNQTAALVNRLNPPWWSDHIAFTRAGGIEIGHLTSMPLTGQSLDILCKNIAAARERIAAPLILENITVMVELPGAEMSEPEFLAELLERADCGLLLDVTNLYINSVNLHFDPIAFLDRIPVERIVQLHFVGGAVRDGVWIDSHAQATPEEIWQLMDEVVRRAPVKGILLERDANIPPFSELRAELDRAREIGARHGRWT